MPLRLDDQDRAMLRGDHGEASRFALSIVVRMAEALGADRLLSIEQAHIDACALMSVSSLDLVERLATDGGRVRVPTTLNMIGLDLDRWRSLGIPEDHAAIGSRIASAYLKLGCVPTWTCAPYEGYLTPRYGQQIAWGESNAVAYANSILGARTNRYADYLDVCAAITGRVPYVGLHIPESRTGHVLVELRDIEPQMGDVPAAWAALGHRVGQLAGDRIPVLEGLTASPSGNAWKAFCAAIASAGGVAMFHAVGCTPEAPTRDAAFGGRDPEARFSIGPSELEASWHDLGPVEEGRRLDAVLLGCPHVSYLEFAHLARTIKRVGLPLHKHVQMVVCTSASQLALARRTGLAQIVEQFGARIALDTCPFHAPLFPQDTSVLMTNSGKCAYYAPGELDVTVAFGTLDNCVESAAHGVVRGGTS